MNVDTLSFTWPAGAVRNLPFDQYLQLPGESASSLKRLMVSPLCYRWAMDHKDAGTRSKSQGTAAHAFILEPHRVDTDFALWTGKVRNGKAWDLFQEANAGKQILNQTEWDEVVAMQSAVRSSPAAMHYLKEGVAEVTMQWTDPHSNRIYHARVDWVTMVDDQLVFVDLKTTRDSSSRKFCSDAYRLGYHIQFALYADGGFHVFHETPRFVVIAVENKAPFDCAVYNVPDEVLEHGHNEYTRLEELLCMCEQSGEWPGRNLAETDLALPAWAVEDDDEDLAELELIP